MAVAAEVTVAGGEDAAIIVITVEVVVGYLGGLEFHGRTTVVIKVLF